MAKPTDIERADGAVTDLVRWYRDRQIAAVLVRTDGNAVRIICPEGVSAGVAKLLYLAADTMADRATADERRTKQ